MRKRLNILTTVNAKNVSRKDGIITIRDVVPIVENICMNGMLYPAEEVIKAYPSLDQVPAPAGHPQDMEGNFISAKSGEALSKAYIGAYVHNARHADGVTYCDISVNEDQANAMPKGRELIAKLEAAINGEAVDPIHVSTGLFLNKIAATGSSKGKAYTGIATNITYDHLAILLDQVGAGTPADGVGMFLNADGAQEQVETVTLVLNQEKESIAERAIKWIGKLFGNEDLSFYETMDKLRASISENYWLVECYATEFIYTDGTKSYKQEYFIGENGVVTFVGSAVEVTRKVEYDEVKTNSEESQMKEQIIAALNAASVGIEGLTDAQILAAYNSLITKPISEQLSAANAKVAEAEQEKRVKLETEVNELATKLAANSALSLDDFKSMNVDLLRKLAGNAQAAPIDLGAKSGGEKKNEFADYSINALMETK